MSRSGKDRHSTRPTVLNQKHTPSTAYAALTLTAFFLACNHIIGRAVHTEIPPVGLSFWRWVVGALILFPFVVGSGKSLRSILGHWPVFMLLGCFMIGSTTLVLLSLTMTSAINVSLINALQPTLTVLFAGIFMNEKLGGRRMLGVTLGFAGVAIMLSRGDPVSLLRLDFQPGDLLAILAMCGFSGYALNLKRLPQGLNGAQALFGITVAGTLLLLPFYGYETLVYRSVPVTPGSIGAILALALLVSVFGNLLWNAGNRAIGPARASIFINLIPVFGIALAVSFLGEQLYLFHLAGGVLVALGLFLAAGAVSSRPAATRES
jgi:drug/metabolite transporter (DMT)-like permease